MYKENLLSIYPLFSKQVKIKQVKIKQVEIIRGKTSQDIAFEFPNKKCGILIAGNAGRPGGYIGKIDGSGINPKANIYNDFHTQEESVIASWLTATKNIYDKKKFSLDEYFKQTLGTNVIKGKKDGRPWGLTYPNMTIEQYKKGTKGFYYTIQGFNFTMPFYDKHKKKFNQAKNYDFSYSLNQVPIFNIKKNNIRIVDLIWCYGPNIAYSKDPNRSGARTKVKDYEYPRDYDVFRECVKTALRAGLIQMIKNKDEIAILCPVSGGIYSGKGSPTNKRINKELVSIINEILSEKLDSSIELSIGDYFDEIILPKL